jgi:hypothetical protein
MLFKWIADRASSVHVACTWLNSAPKGLCSKHIDVIGHPTQPHKLAGFCDHHFLETEATILEWCSLSLFYRTLVSEVVGQSRGQCISPTALEMAA